VPTPANLAREQKAKEDFQRVKEHLERVLAGQPSVDPLEFSDAGELRQMELLGVDGGGP
jgi:hypothetical protein